MKELFEGFRKYLTEQEEKITWPLKLLDGERCQPERLEGQPKKRRCRPAAPERQTGAQRRAVEKLQVFLAQTNKQVQVTGVFDKRTEDALKAFQTKTFTKPTGKVNLEYFNIIIGGKAAFKGGAPTRIGGFTTGAAKAEIGQVAYDKWVTGAVATIKSGLTGQGLTPRKADKILSWFSSAKKAIIKQDGYSGWKKFTNSLFSKDENFASDIKSLNEKDFAEFGAMMKKIFGDDPFITKMMAGYEQLAGPRTEEELSIIKEMSPRNSFLFFKQGKLYWIKGNWRKYKTTNGKVLKTWGASSGHARCLVPGSPCNPIKSPKLAAAIKQQMEEDWKTNPRNLEALFRLFDKKVYQKWKNNGPTPVGIYSAGNYQRKPPWWKNWAGFFAHMMRLDATGIQRQINTTIATKPAHKKYDTCYDECNPIVDNARDPLKHKACHKKCQTEASAHHDRKSKKAGELIDSFYQVMEKAGMLNFKEGADVEAAHAGQSDFYSGKSWNMSDGRSISGRMWGFQRVWLTSLKGEKYGKAYPKYGRKGFSIHGSDHLGSSGCISLDDEMVDFAKYWEAAVGSKSIKLIVDYGFDP